MAAPQFAPTSPVAEPREYGSPPVVPADWRATRPGRVEGFQPSLDGMGYHGPDQGYAMKIATKYVDRLKLQPGEHLADVLRGCLAIAMRRASMFSRAPVVHDLTVVFTAFGFLDDHPPADLVETRHDALHGLVHNPDGYAVVRDLAHSIPAETLRMSPEQVAAAYPGRWRELLGR